jgi:hypothetical protein
LYNRIESNKKIIDEYLGNIKLILNNLSNKTDEKNQVIINNIEDLQKFNYTSSVMLSCDINNNNFNKLKFKSVLEHVYTIIGNGTKIIKNTKLNIKTIKKLDEGFYYLEELGISIQGVTANKCILEIINQCIINKININMCIELENKSIINLSF